MASLLLHAPGAQPTSIPLIKPLTSLGGDPRSDVQIPDLRGIVAIQFDGQRFTATALDGAQLLVNGRRKELHALVDGDALSLGKIKVVFQGVDRLATPGEVVRVPDPRAARAAAAADGSEALAVRRLAEFAAALSCEPDTERALIRLLDSIIEVTRADKGFVLRVDQGKPEVLLARNLQQQDLGPSLERLSDTIVDKAIQRRSAVLVEDASHDSEFQGSVSVVNLKLTSVMCVPLLRRGEVIGAVYVGNDRVAKMFRERELTLMESFCSTAALLLEKALEVDELRRRTRELEQQLADQAYGEIIGSCEPMREIFRRIDKVAGTDITVLITGETGTGKELIARELHRRSPRKAGPFVAINCGAIPENLLESELFGHVKGAFTGAVANRVGRFQSANGGTLFLDEIGEMPMALQVKLLRALQERTVTKVGENKPESIDIRVVAATNKDLETEMRAGRFREDLFYRINVVGMHLPALHQRGEDAVVLAKWFLNRAAKELGTKVKGFTPQALSAVRRYRWPGNIRQLENRIKRAVVLADGPEIRPEDLELRAEELEPVLPLTEAREEWQRRYVQEVLERNAGNRTKTAKDLGVDPRTIFRYLEKMESEREADAPGSLLAPTDPEDA